MKNDKLVFRLVTAISVVVFLAVIVLNRKLIAAPEPTPAFVFKLPLFNAVLNAICSVLLVFSFMSIKKGNITRHKQLNLLTFLLSAVFLVGYVLFHFFVKETSFGGTGAIKYFYYVLLISHIILAAVVLPLILLSFYYGLTDQKERHKKLVRFSFPVWLYVTVSGVLVYLMISPYYPF